MVFFPQVIWLVVAKGPFTKYRGGGYVFVCNLVLNLQIISLPENKLNVIHVCMQTRIVSHVQNVHGVNIV